MPPVSPRLESWSRTASMVETVRGQEAGAAQDQRRVEPGGEVQVTMDLEVLPERPQDQPGLILLDGQDRVPALVRARVPGAADQAVRRVLVLEVRVVALPAFDA